VHRARARQRTEVGRPLRIPCTPTPPAPAPSRNTPTSSATSPPTSATSAWPAARSSAGSHTRGASITRRHSTTRGRDEFRAKPSRSSARLRGSRSRRRARVTSTASGFGCCWRSGPVAAVRGSSTSRTGRPLTARLPPRGALTNAAQAALGGLSARRGSTACDTRRPAGRPRALRAVSALAPGVRREPARTARTQRMCAQLGRAVWPAVPTRPREVRCRDSRRRGRPRHRRGRTPRRSAKHCRRSTGGARRRPGERSAVQGAPR
jgi:hypothetical protein